MSATDLRATGLPTGRRGQPAGQLEFAGSGILGPENLVADRTSLEETIALLEATLEATHDGILVVDLDRTIVRFNRQYLKMFGFTAEELDRGGVEAVMQRLLADLEDPDEARERWRALAADPA